MSKRIVLSCLLAAVAASACGDDATAPVDVVCTVALSGALTSTSTCSTQVAALYTAATDTSVVSGGVQGTPALSVNIKTKGIPVAGTYKNTDTGARGFVSASSASTGWIATTTGVVGNPPPSGSWTMVITSVAAKADAVGGTLYTIHGTIDATMTPIGGGTNLVGKVTF